MTINFRVQYIRFLFITINTYPFKNFLLYLVKPHWKINKQGVLLLNYFGITSSKKGVFKETYYNFSHIGRYNNIFYTRKPNIKE